MEFIKRDGGKSRRVRGVKEMHRRGRRCERVSKMRVMRKL